MTSQIRHGHQFYENGKPVSSFLTTEIKMTKTGGIAADQLKSIIERVEKLMEEKAGIASDIKDIFAESKGNGYHVPILKQIIKLRAKDAAEREEEEHLLDTYARALGMLPLFEEDAA